MKPAFKTLPRLCLLLVCAALFAAHPQAANADHYVPREFIADLGDRAVRALADKSLTPADRQEKFRELFLEGFDVRTLGRFAVGRYWRKATKTQQSVYRGLFTEYVVQTYSSRFGQYSGEKLKVTEQRPVGKKDTLVKSKLVRPEGAPVGIDWRVRERKHELRIIDIIVEGVSMAITQRDEFASVIRRGGGDFNVLIAVLKEKIGQE
jgi:phospholipid transport system substrate-binding protein